MDYKELLANGSGYPDPTAAKAMAEFMRGEKAVDTHGYADGDIIAIETASGEEMEMLILKCHKMYATGLKLLQTRPEENCIAIRSRQMMYADAGRFVYAFYDRIITLVRAMEEDEYEAVRNAVAETMGFQTAGAVQPTTDRTPVLEVDYAAIAKCVRDVFSKDMQDRDEFIRTAAERDVYKKLFEELMKKGANNDR